MKYVCYEVPHYIPPIDFNWTFGNDTCYNVDTFLSPEDIEAQPEKRLWATVLIQGIQGFLHGDSEDTEWFYSNDGFDFVCNLLTLNPNKIRQIILTHKKQVDRNIPDRIRQKAHFQNYTIK